jgi:hypothetical protein
MRGGLDLEWGSLKAGAFGRLFSTRHNQQPTPAAAPQPPTASGAPCPRCVRRG